MKSNCLIWILLLCSSMVFCQSPASVKEYLQAFPTYGFSDPSPIPLIGPVYPYFRFDGFTTTPTAHEWKIVELQNDYIRVLIMPEIGGKIWTAIEKSANRPFIYYNHVVKFRDIAMRGPWSSGGLEPNYGIIGHTPNCATPVDYMTRINPDSSVSCIVGVLDLLTRTNWSVEINLQKDKAFFTTQSFWYNSTGLEQPYYHWMNTGLKAKGGLEFIYPGTKYIGHAGEYADWPVNKNGKNLSFYEQNNFGGYKSYHVFGKYTDFFGAYWHDDDFGMARYSPHDEKAGKKIWIWGLSRQGMIWEKLLTDNDGQYVEVQSGRLFNQNEEKSTFTPFKHRSFSPYQSDTWKEYWYPVLRTKGMVAANEYGALNIKPENGWLKIYFSPAQHIGDTLKIIESGVTIYNRLLNLSPLQSFADSIKLAASATSAEYFTLTLGEKKFLYQSDPNANILHRPVDPPVDFDWTTAYGLYLQGKEWMDQKMYAKAEDKLNECLQKDHNYFPALVRMSELLYRNIRYPEALQMARRALSIDTEAGDANYFYGLINAAMGNTVDARDGFDIATLSVDYRSAAYTALATIYLKEQDYDRAIRYAEKANDYNRYDIPAQCLQAVAYRYQHKDAEARGLCEKIRSADPLNHFVYFEEYLLQPTEERKRAFTTGIRNELPAETYAELAVWYYSLGCTHESETLFSLSPPSAEAACWLAFIHHSKPDLTGINLNSAFFFRAETAIMLQQLPDIQSNWFLKYQLALIFIDRNRIDEARKLLVSCGNDPTFPPFYVVRSGIPGSPATPANSATSAAADTPAPLADLQRALALDPGEWRYHKLLSEYYIAQEQYEKALAVIEPFYLAHPDQYIMGMLYAKTLMLNNRYAAADAVLSALVIIPFEGATNGRELYREAKLTQAIAQLQERHYKKALAFVEMSRQWPDHLGVGKPYDEEIDVRMEDWIDYLIYKQMGAHARADTALQAILRFSPRVDNTIKNFIPANTVVTAWAFQALHKQDQAERWLNQQVKAYPGNPVIIWSKGVFEKGEWIAFPEKINEANIRLIEKLMATSPRQPPTTAPH